VIVVFVDAEPGEVTRLFLLPTASGRGLGSRLLRRGYDDPIKVEATLKATGFYETHGFKTLGSGYKDDKTVGKITRREGEVELAGRLGRRAEARTIGWHVQAAVGEFLPRPGKRLSAVWSKGAAIDSPPTVGETCRKITRADRRQVDFTAPQPIVNEVWRAMKSTRYRAPSEISGCA
jgi:hypothetical protein